MTAMETAEQQPAGPVDEVEPPPPPIWAPSRSHPPRPPLPTLAVAVIRVALLGTVLSSWFVFFVLAIGGLQAARDQQIQYGKLREQLALGTAQIGGVIAPGTPIALIKAPSIGMRQVLVEGTAGGDLRAGPGHRRDTPMPGQAGASVVYGRAITFGGPFRRITQLHSGDTITVITGQGSFDYRVDGVRRAGDPLPDPVASGAGRLTLVSSEGVSWRAGWAPDQLVYVDSTLQGKPQQAPTGRPTVVPLPETAMQGDPGAWVSVVLWLQVLIAGSAAGAWALARWGRAQAWLVCVPLILAGLWGASESVIQLLPNLI
jgi:sortase A